MKFSTNIVAPGIYLYENVIDFTNSIVDLSISDTRNWIIKNQDATEWQFGNKIIGYDEYPIFFNFSLDEKIILLAKKIFDCAADYAVKNLTTVNGFDSCIIRKYSSEPGFLELESSDVENVSRKLTAILFLKDIYEGGKITFTHFNVSVSPKQGSMIVFPASFAYSFKISKPKESDNLIVVSQFV